jgi:hypothetical protein
LARGPLRPRGPGARSVVFRLLRKVLGCVLFSAVLGDAAAQQFALAPQAQVPQTAAPRAPTAPEAEQQPAIGELLARQGGQGTRRSEGERLILNPESERASLLPMGELWVRFGLLDTHGGEERQRSSLPVRIRYSFNDSVGLRLDFEPWVRQTEFNGTTLSGASDATLLLKLSRTLPERQAIGIEAGAKFATAKTGLGTGKDDVVTNFIYSKEFDRYSIDASFGYSRLGTAGPGESRNEFPWYVSITHPIDATWGTTFEWSGTNQGGTKPIMEILGALSYNLSKNWIVVGKVAFGLTDRAPDRTVGVNFIVTFK